MGRRSISLVPTGPTGPRTPKGKARSRFNALKDGIFSTVAVLESESPIEYSNLVKALFADLQPVGKLQEIQVEKIAITLWRSRRLFRAETAEIDAGMALSKRTFASRRDDYYAADELYPRVGSLMRELLSHDLPGLLNGIDRLRELRDRILKDGLNVDRDLADFKTLFDEALDDTVEVDGNEAKSATISGLYLSLVQESREEGKKSTSDGREIMVHRLDKEIEFFEVFADEEEPRWNTLERSRAEQALVPKDNDCDRLIRYEVHLDRTLDRALSQLERLQRMRLGQPVLPPVRVELSK